MILVSKYSTGKVWVQKMLEEPVCHLGPFGPLWFCCLGPVFTGRKWHWLYQRHPLPSMPSAKVLLLSHQAKTGLMKVVPTSCRACRKPDQLLQRCTCGSFASVLTLNPTNLKPKANKSRNINRHENKANSSNDSFRKALPSQTVRLPQFKPKTSNYRKAVKINITDNKNILTCY